jgi:hypothetical protein
LSLLCHNIVFKKREKRKNEPHSNNGAVKSEIDNTIKTLDSSMEIIMAVARYDGNVENENDDNNKDKIETKSEPVSTTNIIKPDFSVSNKVVDLYEFKSDDEFGDDSVLVL